MSKDLKLAGFDCYNLLAFLALLGMLKTIEISCPEWKPRLSWKYRIPYLHISADVNEREIAEAIVNGIIKIGDKMRFDNAKNLKLSVEEFHELQKQVPYEIMAVLGSDGSLKIDTDIVEYPPLCMLLGQGKQNFLERLDMATKVGKNDQVIQEILDVFSDRWDYKDKSTITFRWDPKEYRIHAQSALDPSKDKFQTINGANRLAAVGFTNYVCVPTYRGLETTACIKQRHVTHIMWPIWHQKLSLATILMIMCHPHMKKISNRPSDEIISEIHNMGIHQIMLADIFQVGQFFNVKWARRVI